MKTLAMALSLLAMLAVGGDAPPESAGAVAEVTWALATPADQLVSDEVRSAQESVPDQLTVTRFEDGESFTGPPDRFTGDVQVESLFKTYPPGRTGGAMVRFKAGARTAWHSHPLGQVLVITSGVGWVQSEGQGRLTVRPGDVVRIPPNVRHWHGASADQAMSHLAVLESLDGESTHWMELVTDEEYEGRDD
jgi:4-carboxymuconolactone decarboxylase